MENVIKNNETNLNSLEEERMKENKFLAAKALIIKNCEDPSIPEHYKKIWIAFKEVFCE